MLTRIKKMVGTLGKLTVTLIVLILALLLMAMLIPPSKVPGAQSVIIDAWWGFTAVRVAVISVLSLYVWPLILRRKLSHWQAEVERMMSIMEESENEETAWQDINRYAHYCENRLIHWQSMQNFKPLYMLLIFLSIEGLFAQLPFMLMIL